MTIIYHADNAIVPLADIEADAVSGGLLHAIGVALTIYTAADIVYDFYRGFRDGVSGVPN